jgi:adenine-specific DNA-methyltransferase
VAEQIAVTAESYEPPMTAQQLAIWPPSATGAVFRPVHYLGCKLRVLELLERVLDEVDPTRGQALDLFSGTGVVAAQLAQTRPVVAADIQEYARVLASALLADAAPSREQATAHAAAAARRGAALGGPRLEALMAHERACLADAEAGSPEALCTLIEEGSLLRTQLEPPADRRLASLLAHAAAEIPPGPDTVLTRYYGGVYFSYEQATVLDGLASVARTLPQPLRDVGLAAVMSTASEIVSSIGNQFAQPLRPRDRGGRPKRSSLRMAARRRQLAVGERFVRWIDRYASLPTPRHAGIAVRGDFAETLASPPAEIAVVYADPPYTRDHYSRYYHVLETIALGDEPTISRMRLGRETLVSRGLYREQRHQSPFCIKSQAPEAFASLFAGARRLDAPLVLSYSPHGEGSASRPRVMAIDAIVQLAREWYGDVAPVSAGRLAHSKLNASRLNSATVYDAEMLIVCRP